jgi:hypothetical protein
MERTKAAVRRATTCKQDLQILITLIFYYKSQSGDFNAADPNYLALQVIVA